MLDRLISARLREIRTRSWSESLMERKFQVSSVQLMKLSMVLYEDQSPKLSLPQVLQTMRYM